MEDYKESDQINFRELFSIIWQARIIIFSLTSFFFIVGIFFSLSLTNLYKSTALLKISEPENSNVIGGNISGLASLVGANLSPSGSSKLYFARDFLKSRELFNDLISDEETKAILAAVTGYDPILNKLIYDENIYNPIKKSWSKDVSNYQLHQKFNSEIMEVEIDYESQFIKMSVAHQSPIFAKELLELIVSKTNSNLRFKDQLSSTKAIDYLQSKLMEISFVEIKRSFNELLKEELKTQMLVNIREDYFFEYIQSPQVTENKFYPKRSQISVIFGLFGFLFSVIFAVFRFYTSEVRK